jgi:hypothetical protein
LKVRIYSLLILLFFACPIILPQHGAYIAPVFKFTTINGQGAVISGIKAGWIINKTFVIGAAYYGLSSDITQNWVDPVTGQAPMVKITTGGLNFEYVFFSDNFISGSAEFFMGGAGINIEPGDKSKTHTVFYGGDFLIWEPQLNANINLNDWFHLSLGVSYRTTNNLDFYPGNDPAGPDFPIKNLRGFTGTLSFIFGMY